VKFKHVYLTLLNLFSATCSTGQTTELICTHDASNDADLPKEVPFEVSLMKNFFHGGIILPQEVQRAVYMQIEKVD
jgi:hypothetical protein